MSELLSMQQRAAIKIEAMGDHDLQIAWDAWWETEADQPEFVNGISSLEWGNILYIEIIYRRTLNPQNWPAK